MMNPARCSSLLCSKLVIFSPFVFFFLCVSFLSSLNLYIPIPLLPAQSSQPDNSSGLPLPLLLFLPVHHCKCKKLNLGLLHAKITDEPPSEPGASEATGGSMLVPEARRLLGFLVHSVDVLLHAFLFKCVLLVLFRMGHLNVRHAHLVY